MDISKACASLRSLGVDEGVDVFLLRIRVIYFQLSEMLELFLFTTLSELLLQISDQLLERVKRILRLQKRGAHSLILLFLFKISKEVGLSLMLLLLIYFNPELFSVIVYLFMSLKIDVGEVV